MFRKHLYTKACLKNINNDNFTPKKKMILSTLTVGATQQVIDSSDSVKI